MSLCPACRKEINAFQKERRSGAVNAQALQMLPMLLEEQIPRIEKEQRGAARDLAYLREGRVADVKRLAEEIYPIFEAQDVHREAIAALRLFQEAAVAARHAEGCEGAQRKRTAAEKFERAVEKSREAQNSGAPPRAFRRFAEL